MKKTRFRNNFFTGLVVLLPAIVTLLIISWVVTRINRNILNPILRLDFFSPYLANARMAILLKVGVFLIIATLFLFGISLVGLAAHNIIIRRVFSWGERIIFRMPMINTIYTTTRQIGNAFLGGSNAAFRQVVLVEYPRSGLYSLGFVTSSGKGKIQSPGGKPLLSVFIPTAPNPTSGMMVFIPEDQVIPLAMSVGEGLKLVVSAGAVTSSYKVDKPQATSR